MKRFRRKVIHGIKMGRKLGFPTLNFHTGTFGQFYVPGVYVSTVVIGTQSYVGALYFGPKGGGRDNVLEIHVIGFSGNLYGRFISFLVGKKIRKPKKFASSEALKTQISGDLRQVVLKSGS